MPHLYSQLHCHIYIPFTKYINHRHLFSARFFKWGQKQLSSQLCILQKLFHFGHTTAFFSHIFLPSFFAPSDPVSVWSVFPLFTLVLPLFVLLLSYLL